MIFVYFLRLWNSGGKQTFFPSFIIQMWLHFMVWYRMDQEEQWPLLPNSWLMALLGMYYFARIGNALKRAFAFQLQCSTT